MGLNQLDAGLPYPAWLARWPAVLLLFAGLWAELVLPASYNALTVANLLVGYTVLTLAGMALFGRVAWLRNAEHGNACAQRLLRQIGGVPGLEIMFPVQANAVFVRMLDTKIAALRDRGWQFYTFIGGGARFMFAWDAEPRRVDELAADLGRIALMR